MKVREFDMHGKTVAEAVEIYFKVLDEVRLARRFEVVHFITGKGPIKETLEKLCRDHGLHAVTPMANHGMLMIEFE